MDLDLCGTANRVEYLKIRNKGERHPDLADPKDTVYVWRLERVLKRREKETLYKHSLSQPMYVIFSSANATNRYGNRRSYRIQPLTMSRLMLPDRHAIKNAVRWAMYPVFDNLSLFIYLFIIWFMHTLNHSQ